MTSNDKQLIWSREITKETKGSCDDSVGLAGVVLHSCNLHLDVIDVRSEPVAKVTEHCRTEKQLT
jgi:hypothetical protein